MMTYTESAALMNDITFRGRVKVACLKFSTAIMDESGDVPAHNTRMRWAQGCYQNPDQTSSQITPPTVMDSAVQADGADISDDALQGSVEAVVRKII